MWEFVNLFGWLVAVPCFIIIVFLILFQLLLLLLLLPPTLYPTSGYHSTTISTLRYVTCNIWCGLAVLLPVCMEWRIHCVCVREREGEFVQHRYVHMEPACTAICAYMVEQSLKWKQKERGWSTLNIWLCCCSFNMYVCVCVFAAAQFGVMCSGFITILCKMLNNRSKTKEFVSLSRNVLADSFTFKTHLLGISSK